MQDRGVFWVCFFLFFPSLAKELASYSSFGFLSYFLQQHLCWDFKKWHRPLFTLLSFPQPSSEVVLHPRKMEKLLGLPTLGTGQTLLWPRLFLSRTKCWQEWVSTGNPSLLETEDNPVFKQSLTTPRNRILEGSPGTSLIPCCHISSSSIYKLIRFKKKKNPTKHFVLITATGGSSRISTIAATFRSTFLTFRHLSISS